MNSKIQAKVAADEAYDKSHGIKEDSPQDKALDKKRGIPEGYEHLRGKEMQVRKHPSRSIPDGDLPSGPVQGMPPGSM